MEADEVGGFDQLPDPDDTGEAYVDTVEDGINTGVDSEFSHSYWQILKHSMLTYFSNPWALLILAYILFKVYGKLKQTLLLPLFDRIEDWNEQRKESEEAARIKKNPDQYRAKVEGMEEARNRMQARYAEAALEWRKKQDELEEKKRQQDIQDWDDHVQGKGYKNRAGVGVDKEREQLEQQAKLKSKKTAKPDNYNPLMGGSGSGYRPAARRLATGGG
jgi:hypothetical protein